jgi:hypothetical protein
MITCFHEFSSELHTFSIFIRILLLFFLFDVYVWVLYIYKHSTVKGAKKIQYGAFIGTKLSHIKRWKSDIFSITRYQRSKAMVLYPSSYESNKPKNDPIGVCIRETAAKYCKTSRSLTTYGTLRLMHNVGPNSLMKGSKVYSGRSFLGTRNQPRGAYLRRGKPPSKLNLILALHGGALAPCHLTIEISKPSSSKEEDKEALTETSSSPS